MTRALAIFLLSIAAAFAHASDNECTKLAARTNGPENNFRPPLEGTVVGSGNLNFYSAPNDRCRMKGPSAAVGSYLTIYKPHENWVNVMYIQKGGKDIIGWAPKDRVKIVGQYGRNP